MTTVRRSIGKAVAMVTLGTGLALTVSPALAPAAHAQPVRLGDKPPTTLCYWDGKSYSAGGRKEFRGEIYVCQSDGTWKKEGSVVSPAVASNYTR